MFDQLFGLLILVLGLRSQSYTTAFLDESAQVVAVSPELIPPFKCIFPEMERSPGEESDAWPFSKCQWPCFWKWPLSPWCWPWPKPSPIPLPSPYPIDLPLPSAWPTEKPWPTPWPCDDISDRLCIKPLPSVTPVPWPTVDPCFRDEYGMPCPIDLPLYKPSPQPSAHPTVPPLPTVVPIPLPKPSPDPCLETVPCSFPCDDPRFWRPCPVVDDPGDGTERVNPPPNKPIHDPKLQPPVDVE